ncbi:hypothetical protein OE699_04590 [Sedimentimonas flavescens]|uniref:Uncharacterized protein n=1 Tax=Sedimentimonas flavescens TaxID=2851012 RepID=A0ABT2ZX88_9RHOB|nr:hypothetical protein [Sedimentimonas flavescens]MCT2540096.1 hypothetical protein [Sedimentimonas flavescens]MCV2878124.1 hypothetical protein [Sedimentimonas flavescens]
MQDVKRYSEDRLPRSLVLGGGGLLLAVVAGLFWLVWESQFAAPAGYLFDTPTQPVEAGYCLAVAQAVGAGGVPVGGPISEAQDFWIARLRGYTSDMARPIAAGQAALARDMAQTDRAWLLDAMEACMRRAITYGAHFRSFD